MVNLVGKEGYSGLVKFKNIEHILAIEGVNPHIYGKKKTRPYRKMGHITVINKDLNTARKIAEEVKQTIEVITNDMTKVSIIMGSQSDLPVMNEAIEILNEFKIKVEVDIVSAHRTPEKMSLFGSEAHKGVLKLS